MITYAKTAEGKLEITETTVIPETTKVNKSQTTIGELTERRAVIEKRKVTRQSECDIQLATYDAEIAKIDAQIAEAQKLGVVEKVVEKEPDAKE